MTKPDPITQTALANHETLASCLRYPNHNADVVAPPPLLVFVHGFLGSQTDWQACTSLLSGLPVLTVDLPGHGESAHIECDGLDHAAHLLCATVAWHLERLSLQHVEISGVILIGYSMGARIVMNGIAHSRFDALPLLGAVIEAGHFGLVDDAVRLARLENDRAWAKRFVFEPIEQVLVDWYQQAVFSSLKHEQRQTLVAKRSANLGGSVAKMLLATSLATQSDLLPLLRHQASFIHYVCGELDEKFKTLAQESGLSVSVVASAGHNVHQEQPEAFCRVVQQCIPK